MKIEDIENINKVIFDSQAYLLEKIRHHNCEIESMKNNYEKRIQELGFKLTSAYAEINSVYSSPRYITGRFILSPFIVLKKILRLR